MWLHTVTLRTHLQLGSSRWHLLIIWTCMAVKTAMKTCALLQKSWARVTYLRGWPLVGSCLSRWHQPIYVYKGSTDWIGGGGRGEGKNLWSGAGDVLGMCVGQLEGGSQGGYDQDTWYMGMKFGLPVPTWWLMTSLTPVLGELVLTSEFHERQSLMWYS